MRNSLIFGTKPSRLCALCVEDKGDTWKKDFEVHLTENLADKLSIKSGIDKNKIVYISYHASCDNYYTHLHECSQVKWVIPGGIKSNKNNTGYQVCPLCLKMDGNFPYFRKNWRLGFFTSCLLHHCKLVSKCPNCSSRIDLRHIKKICDPLLYSPKDMLFCNVCGFNLSHSEAKLVDDKVYFMNKLHQSLIENGSGNVFGIPFIYSNLYFEGVRRLISFFFCLKKPRSKLVPFYIENHIILPNSKHLEPELLPIELREKAFILIYDLLQNWPISFHQILNKYHVLPSEILSPYLNYPYWIIEEIRPEHK